VRKTAAQEVEIPIFFDRITVFSGEWVSQDTHISRRAMEGIASDFKILCRAIKHCKTDPPPKSRSELRKVKDVNIFQVFQKYFQLHLKCYTPSNMSETSFC
jgi:hypothetical protein